MARVLIGRIGRRHGLGDEFYMTAFMPLPEDLKCVFLEDNPDSLGEDSRQIRIDSLTQAADKWLVTFTAGDDSLTGKYISCEKWDLDGGFFWREDLVGCEVSEPSGRKLGRLSEIIDDASQVWIRIEEESGEMISVPFLERFVKKVDTRGKKIIASFPESVIVRGE
ncbi:MAG: hypothetical protein Q7J59_05385 [Elusimicrobiota bacterium]|nr:hypothetical protein [Elusimicrobiota bacterium]